MSKLVTVIGATGAQGGSVVAAALKSDAYKVRGVTRNVDSDASKALIAKGFEMVAADVNDESSLVRAFEVHVSLETPAKLWWTTAANLSMLGVERDLRRHGFFRTLCNPQRGRDHRDRGPAGHKLRQSSFQNTIAAALYLEHSARQHQNLGR